MHVAFDIESDLVPVLNGIRLPGIDGDVARHVAISFKPRKYRDIGWWAQVFIDSCH